MNIEERLAESVLGEGTTVTLHLPLEPAAEATV